MDVPKKQRSQEFPKAKDMSNEQLKNALVKKKECDARALLIVNRLIENPIPINWFVYCLRFINKSHLEDVIEERAIAKLCGYPICVNALGNIPKQQYCISIKRNKVYDLSERKNFCSNQCYKAAIFIKEQMLTSPLWLRDREEIPDFKLLPWQTEGAIGVEVDFGLQKIKDDEKFLSVADFTEDSLSDVPEDFSHFDYWNVNDFASKNKNTTVKKQFKTNDNSLTSIKENDVETNEPSTSNQSVNENYNIKLEENGSSDVSNANIEFVNKSNENFKTKNTMEVPSEISGNSKQNESTKECTEKLVPDIKVDSENIVVTESKNDLENKNCSEDISNSVTDFLSDLNKHSKSKSVESQLNCQMRKLNIGGKVNAKKGKSLLSSNLKLIKEKIEKNTSVRKTIYIEPQPLVEVKAKPDILKKKLSESEKIVKHVEQCFKEWFTADTLMLIYGEPKVHEMLQNKSGDFKEQFLQKITMKSLESDVKYQKLCKKLDIMELEEEKFNDANLERKLQPVPDFNTLKEESLKMDLRIRSFFAGKTVYEINNECGPEDAESDDERPILLPVDSNSQNTLRRKILSNHINKALPQTLDSLGWSGSELRNDVRKMINTFHLTSKNILFKPVHSNLLCLIIIKFLSEENPRLQALLKEQSAVRHIEEIMNFYKLPHDYVDTLYSKMANVDNVL